MACQESLALLFMVSLLFDLVLMQLEYFMVGAGVVLVARGSGRCSLNVVVVGTFITRAHRRALGQSRRLDRTVTVASHNGRLTDAVVGHGGGDEVVWLHSWTTTTMTTVGLMSRRLRRGGSRSTGLTRALTSTKRSRRCCCALHIRHGDIFPQRFRRKGLHDRWMFIIVVRNTRFRCVEELVVHGPLFRNCIVTLWSKRMILADFDVLVKVLLLLMLLVEVHFWVLFVHTTTIVCRSSSSLLPQVEIGLLSVETHASKGGVGSLSCQFDKVATG